MRFNPDATVWIAKQRILCTLNQTLKDVLNYGLFQPASNGRDGKFLDEERLLREYPQPFSKGVPCLEVSCCFNHVIQDSALWRDLGAFIQSSHSSYTLQAVKAN
ncbi:SH3 and multiple ankyrin repeat domains protein 1, partial [Xenoophorus captivus]